MLKSLKQHHSRKRNYRWNEMKSGEFHNLKLSSKLSTYGFESWKFFTGLFLVIAGKVFYKAEIL